jgi:ABC-2 type transport system permease protein
MRHDETTKPTAAPAATSGTAAGEASPRTGRREGAPQVGGAPGKDVSVAAGSAPAGSVAAEWVRGAPGPRREGLLRTGVLVRHNTSVLLHEPGPLIGRLVMPLMMLLAMRPLYRAAQGTAGTAQAVVGSLVMFSLLALSVVGTSILSERAWRTWDRLRATPVRPLELLVGKAVPVLGVLAAQQVVVLGFGVVAFGMRVADPGLLVAACAAWGLALLGMGSAVGLLARSYGQLSAVLDIGAFFLTTLGGALVPLSTLPGWVRAVAPLSPGYWGADCLRHAAAGDAGRTLTGVGVLLAVAAGTGAIAAWRVARGWGRATAV